MVETGHFSAVAARRYFLGLDLNLAERAGTASYIVFLTNNSLTRIVHIYTTGIVDLRNNLHFLLRRTRRQTLVRFAYQLARVAALETHVVPVLHASDQLNAL